MYNPSAMENDDENKWSYAGDSYQTSPTSLMTVSCFRAAIYRGTSQKLKKNYNRPQLAKLVESQEPKAAEKLEKLKYQIIKVCALFFTFKATWNSAIDDGALCISTLCLKWWIQYDNDCI